MGIIGRPLKNMPWEDKPGDCRGLVWRYSGNPIIDRTRPDTAEGFTTAQ